MHQHPAVPVFMQPCVIENRIAFAPKYRRKVFFGEKRREIGKILRQLCEWKKVTIVKAEVCPEHIHVQMSDRTNAA